MTNHLHSPLTRAERIAQFRLMIIGELLASPPDKGDLKNQLQLLANKPWLNPFSGDIVYFSLPTLERWYYKTKNSPDHLLKPLTTQLRNDKGIFKSINQAIRDALTTQYNDYKNWSVKLHYDNLIVSIEKHSLQSSNPSYSSILRYMRANNMPRKSKRRGPNSPGAKKAANRLEKREVRSYEVDFINGLWHLDFHHGSLKVLHANGTWVTPLLLAIMDDHSRLVCHMQWYYSEDTECLVHGFCQALQKRALPRGLMTDNGSAMISAEFTRGLFELNIVHYKTLPYSAYQNGKQETFWSNVEGRLLAMLENHKDLTLRKLNHMTQAWIEGDYHKKANDALNGQTPINCYLQDHDVGRVCPKSQDLQRAFRRQTKRKQRRSDGSISVEKKRFEIPNIYQSLENITIQYARWNLSNIDMVDPDTSKIITPLYPQDKSANANGLRRPRTPEQQIKVASASETPPYLQKLLDEHAATGLPQSYIPKDELGGSE